MSTKDLSFSAPDSKIHIYHNMLSKSFEQILDIIDSLDKIASDSSPITKWSRWGSSNEDPENLYAFGEQKRFDHNRCLSDLQYIDIYKTLRDPIVEASEHYALLHEIEIGQLAPLSFSRYFEGKRMGPHVDSHESDDRPTISVVMYLNDDYEGGELYFKEQDVKIKASHGDIVIFPSKPPYYHESQTIISGVKYICPGFWYKL